MPENTRKQSEGVPFGRALRDVSLGIGAFVCAMGLVMWMATLPTVDAYVGPRPTVEQVKIFTCNYDASCAENLEAEVNGWLSKSGAGIRVIDRKFVVTERECYHIAIFYEKLAERPAAQKLPAEKQ